MRHMCRVFFLGAAFTSLFALLAFGQDAPSLGEVARQTRAQKQPKDTPGKDAPGAARKDASGKDASAKDAQGKDTPPAKAPKVITNDEIPARVGPTAPAHVYDDDQPSRVSYTPKSGGGRVPGETWKAQIQAQKRAINWLTHMCA